MSNLQNNYTDAGCLTSHRQGTRSLFHSLKVYHQLLTVVVFNYKLFIDIKFNISAFWHFYHFTDQVCEVSRYPARRHYFRTTITQVLEISPLAAALAHFNQAVSDWEAYARSATSQYNPQLFSRTHYMDWWKILEDVKEEARSVQAEETKPKELKGQTADSNPKGLSR